MLLSPKKSLLILSLLLTVVNIIGVDSTQEIDQEGNNNLILAIQPRRILSSGGGQRNPNYDGQKLYDDRIKEEINNIIEGGADINHANNSGTTALMKAADSCNPIVIEIILTNPNIQLLSHNQLLKSLQLASNKCPLILSMLASYASDADYMSSLDEESKIKLHKYLIENALNNRQTEEVKRLIETSGLNVNDIMLKNNSRPILSQVIIDAGEDYPDIENYIELIQFLIDSGADVNASYENQYRKSPTTPLISASAAGKARIVKLLLDTSSLILDSNQQLTKALELATENLSRNNNLYSQSMYSGSGLYEKSARQYTAVLNLLMPIVAWQEEGHVKGV